MLNEAFSKTTKEAKYFYMILQD